MAMTNQQKLDFVHKQTKLALEHVQHFDQGGTVLTGPTPATGGGSGATTPGGLFGGINSFLGTNNQYQATAAPIQQGTNAAQLNQAYTGAQGALQNATGLQGSLAPGVNQGAASQNFLTNQLMNQAQGIGPNPAQAALNQNTGRNIAQQAALQAGQRGAGANPGLAALNAANVGANLQQQAVGQEAVLGAGQQLAAQQALTGLAGQQVGQGTNATQLQNQVQQNEQNILQGANTAANNAAVSSQQNINTTNAQIAAGNAQAAGNTAGGIGSALGSIGGFLLGFAEGGKVPAHLAHLHETAKIYHPHMMAGGGKVDNVPGYEQGGMAWQNSVPVSSQISGGAAFNAPSQDSSFLGGLGKGISDHIANSEPDEEEEKEEPAKLGTTGPVEAYHNDVPAATLGNPLAETIGSSPSLATAPSLGAMMNPMMGPNAVYIAKGGQVGGKLKEGGKVPGKPKIGHDSYSNDTVSAKLSPGEVVIDLNTLKDKGKLGKMARFVAQNIERKKTGRKL